MEDKTDRILTDLFQAYLNRQEQLPDHIYQKCKTQNPERVICDYIAGMTDRFAQDEHRKLFDPHAQVWGFVGFKIIFEIIREGKVAPYTQRIYD